MNQYRFIELNEKGEFHFEGLTVDDTEYGWPLYSHLNLDDQGRVWSYLQNTDVIVEAYDEPLVVRQVEKQTSGHWELILPYEYRTSFSPHTLSVDEWDRFHGYDEKGLPFVFSRSAQWRFFNLVDEMDETSVTVDGERIELPDWLPNDEDVEKESFWTNIYQMETPRWELGQPAPALKDMLSELELDKSRILVPGCGSGNDAAHLAQAGHTVTAIDVSEEAIKQARKKYGHLSNLAIEQRNIFDLPSDWQHSFDFIFEHICYCAVNPQRREELVQTWKNLLTEKGHVLGIFFVRDRRERPPYGGSEWEVRERLKKDFNFLFWNRWRQSIDRRMGVELVIYAQKKPGVG